MVCSVFLGLIVAVVLVFLIAFPFGQNKMGVGQYYLDNTVKETGAENVVTAVTLQYRGCDTMGEVTHPCQAEQQSTTIASEPRVFERIGRSTRHTPVLSSRVHLDFSMLQNGPVTTGNMLHLGDRPTA